MLGKRIVGSVLRAAGWAVRDYGGSAADLAARTRADRLQLLLVSALMLPSALEVKKLMAALSTTSPRVRVAVGGAPFLFDVCGLAVANARAFQDVRRAKESLAFERERLAVTLDSIGDGVIATDRDGNVLLVNRVCAELTGFSRNEPLGRPLFEVFRLLDEGYSATSPSRGGRGASSALSARPATSSRPRSR